MHEPKTAYARALLLGQEYQRELLLALRIADEGSRVRRIDEIASQYRDPALELLHDTRDLEGPLPTYVAALIAAYENDHPRALADFRRLQSQYPWFYEAHRAEGDAYVAQASAAINQGHDDLAREHLDAGRRAYQAAIEIAPSVAALHRALADLELSALSLELYRRDGEVDSRFEHGLAAANHALEVDADDIDALLSKAGLARAMAEHRLNTGSEADDVTQEGIAAAQRALDRNPGLDAGWLELMRLYRLRAVTHIANDEEIERLLNQSLQAGERVDRSKRDAAYWASLALSYDALASSIVRKDADPLAKLKEAESAYRRAGQLAPQAFNVWINLADNLRLQAESLREDESPLELLNGAMSALETAQKLRPGHPAALFQQGVVAANLADQQLPGEMAGLDWIDRAIEIFAEGSEKFESILAFRIAHLRANLTRCEILLGLSRHSECEIDRIRSAISSLPASQLAHATIRRLESDAELIFAWISTKTPSKNRTLHALRNAEASQKALSEVASPDFLDRVRALRIRLLLIEFGGVESAVDEGSLAQIEREIQTLVYPHTSQSVASELRAHLLFVRILVELALGTENPKKLRALVQQLNDFSANFAKGGVNAKVQAELRQRIQLWTHQATFNGG
jgi:tetratricopeptide (TPR) repeat protein